MRTINCRRCNKIYSYEGLPPSCCPECQSKKDAKLQQVRELIKESPGINVAEVHRLTGVPISVIMQCIKDGDVEVKDDKPNKMNSSLEETFRRR